MLRAFYIKKYIRKKILPPLFGLQLYSALEKKVYSTIKVLLTKKCLHSNNLTYLVSKFNFKLKSKYRF